MKAEEKLERISCRKWSCKIGSDLVWENDGLELLRKQVAVSHSAPCAAPPQSSVSLENGLTGIWSTQGREELA